MTEDFDIDALPELDTQVGMIGTMTQVEVGGQICLETGVLVITHL
jgi:hypothetical protein